MAMFSHSKDKRRSTFHKHGFTRGTFLWSTTHTGSHPVTNQAQLCLALKLRWDEMRSGIHRPVWSFKVVLLVTINDLYAWLTVFMKVKVKFISKETIFVLCRESVHWHTAPYCSSVHQKPFTLYKICAANYRIFNM